MVALKQRKVIKPTPRHIPPHLIYEILDGQPIYYKGYREVIQNKKQRKKLWEQAVFRQSLFRI